VAFIAASIADEFGLPEAEIDIIISAALLHDIGKAGIDYKILAKDGEEIPIGARIIGLAETIDGLLSGSTYREALSIKETIAEIRRCSGTQFDPQLVQIAVQLLENGRIG